MFLSCKLVIRYTGICTAGKDLPVKSSKSITKVVPKTFKRIVVELRTNQMRQTVASFSDSQHVVEPFFLVLARSFVPANVANAESGQRHDIPEQCDPQRDVDFGQVDVGVERIQQLPLSLTDDVTTQQIVHLIPVSLQHWVQSLACRKSVQDTLTDLVRTGD